MSKPSLTRQEVAKHNKVDDCWIIIDSKVYDVSSFLATHPGGEHSIMMYAGQEATEAFLGLHRVEVLKKYGPKLLVGTISGEKEIGFILPSDQFSQVPYAEPPAWMQGFSSPYYNESHKKFKHALRKFYTEEVLPLAVANTSKNGDVPKEINQKMAESGVLPTKLGPGPHLKGWKLIGDVDAKEFDFFHEMIGCEETARIGDHGYTSGLFGGMSIGLPPVIHFANNAQLRDRVVKEVFSGEKRIALAISEPYAGSDVAHVKTTAIKSPCGKYYIVNGMKKWITGGNVADYFTTAVNTGKGLSLLLIPRVEGVTTEKIKTSYSLQAGTAWVFFKDARVPVENLLGEENKGFACVMANFNHERWMMCASNIAYSRLLTEEAFKWANQRKVFGKSLLEQPVIRQKLARMVSEVEGVHNWLENVTYQMTKMSYVDQGKLLAGPIALLKYRCTRVAYQVNDDAIQIFGGRAITASGMGRILENLQRSVKFDAILGGSEEIMADLGIRQAMKSFPKNAKL